MKATKVIEVGLAAALSLGGLAGCAVFQPVTQAAADTIRDQEVKTHLLKKFDQMDFGMANQYSVDEPGFEAEYYQGVRLVAKGVHLSGQGQGQEHPTTQPAEGR